MIGGTVRRVTRRGRMAASWSTCAPTPRGRRAEILELLRAGQVDCKPDPVKPISPPEPTAPKLAVIA